MTGTPKNLLLTFPDGALEARYAAFLTTNSFSRVDRFFLQFSILMHLVVSVWTVYNKESEVRDLLPLAESFMIILVQLVVVRSRLWEKNRTILGVGFRLVKVICFTRGAATWIGDAKPTVGSLFKSVVLMSGSLVSVWLPIGMPLMFRHHITVQVVGVVYLVWRTRSNMCVEVLDMCEDAFKGVLASIDDIMLVLGGGPISHDFMPVPSNSVLCGRLIVLSLLVIGLLLPTSILYYLELVSRSSFLANQSAAGAQLETGPINLIQGMVFVAVSIACMWSLSACLVS